MLRTLDLFAGIGGFSLGLERTGGFRTVAFCEIDPYRREVLARHWPDVPCHDDVTTRIFSEGEADVICGGFPCQDLSNAGKRAGLAGKRSGLYRELVRAIRVVRPLHAIVENVAALLGSGMGTVLGDLAESGADAEWNCVPACALGAPHERDRVWIVAHANGVGRCAGEAGEVQSRRSVRDEHGIGEGPAHGRPDIESRASGGAADAPHAAAASGARLPGGEATKITFAGGDAEYAPDAESDRRGPGRAGRPPDSFARIRDAARRNAADPYGARLSFGQGFGGDARPEREAAQRDAGQALGQSIWPDEPALLGVDDELPARLDRTKALGDTVVPLIPQLIGEAIKESLT